MNTKYFMIMVQVLLGVGFKGFANDQDDVKRLTKVISLQSAQIIEMQRQMEKFEAMLANKSEKDIVSSLEERTTDLEGNVARKTDLDSTKTELRSEFNVAQDKLVLSRMNHGTDKDTNLAYYYEDGSHYVGSFKDGKKFNGKEYDSKGILVRVWEENSARDVKELIWGDMPSLEQTDLLFNQEIRPIVLDAYVKGHPDLRARYGFVSNSCNWLKRVSGVITGKVPWYVDTLICEAKVKAYIPQNNTIKPIFTNIRMIIPSKDKNHCKLSDGIWDKFHNRCVFIKKVTFIGHTYHIHAANFSPDGRYVVTGGKDKIAIIWDTATGRRVSTLSGHTAAINTANFSPDGSYVVTGGEDKTAIIWRYGHKVRTLSGHTSAINTANFSPDGSYVVTGCEDDEVIIWDAKTGAKVRTLIKNNFYLKRFVTTANFSPDGGYVVTGSDKRVIIWDAKTGAKVRTLTRDTSSNAANFSPDGMYVVTGGFGLEATIWDTGTGYGFALKSEDTQANINAATFSPDGRYVAIGYDDCRTRIWEVKSRKIILTIDSGYTGFRNNVSFSPDGNYLLIAGGPYNTARIFDVSDAVNYDDL